MSYALRRLALRRFNRASARILRSIEFATGDSMTADAAGGCEGSAPEGTSGTLVARVASMPANADQLHKRPARAKPRKGSGGARVSRSRAGRTHDAVTAAAVPTRDAAGAPHLCDHSGDGAPADCIVPLGAIGAAKECPPRGGALPRAERIDLSVAPSGMERAASAWRDAAGAAPEVPAMDDGKAWCGPCDARVPTWFGKDCIAGKCPLKVAA